jgi:hypothetical protein
MAVIGAVNRMHSVEQRLARWLLMHPDRSGRDIFPDDSRVPRIPCWACDSVAAEALQKLGVIGYQRGAIRVVDVERLEVVACQDYRLARAGYEQMHGWAGVDCTGLRPRWARSA